MVNSLCHSFYSSADVLSNNQQIQTIINVINEVMSFKFDFSNFADDNAPLSLQQNFKDLQIRETSVPYLIGICCVGYCVEDVRKPREAKRTNLSAKNKNQIKPQTQPGSRIGSQTTSIRGSQALYSLRHALFPYLLLTSFLS